MVHSPDFFPEHSQIFFVNPFTALACKIPGLKDARMHLSYNTSTFSAMRFDKNAFTCQCETLRRNKGFWVSDFALLLVVLGDILAVKGLRVRHFCMALVEQLGDDGRCLCSLLPYGTGICHCAFISTTKIISCLSIPFFVFFFNLVSII